MWIGTVVIGVMTLVATSIGIFAKGILTQELSAYGTIDNITPRTIVECMSPFWAGVCIIGPVAATISTVSSLLLTAAGSIVKDVYMNIRVAQGKPLDNESIKKLSLVGTIIIGFAVYFISIAPPSVTTWI